MFLKALFKFNKLYFLVSVLLLFIFLFINYKWGMVAAPISHYGMYSGIYKTQTPKTIYTHTVNGKVINSQNLTIIQNDFLQSFPAFYENEKNINLAVFKTMLPYLSRLGLAREKDSAKFLNHYSEENFKNWYTEKLAGIVHEKIDSFSIQRQDYIWQENHLMPIAEATKINLY